MIPVIAAKMASHNVLPILQLRISNPPIAAAFGTNYAAGCFHFSALPPSLALPYIPANAFTTEGTELH